MRFESKRVIVTGAARGIGRAIAAAFLREGADVFAVDWNAEGLESLVSELGGYSIVQAESHEAAATLFANSPHLTMPGATVEVMEIMPMPGM